MHISKYLNNKPTYLHVNATLNLKKGGISITTYLPSIFFIISFDADHSSNNFLMKYALSLTKRKKHCMIRHKISEERVGISTPTRFQKYVFLAKENTVY